MRQRQSPRGPLQLRTSSSDSDSSHHRPIPDKSPKIGDRQSPRSVQSEPVNQRKLGTRIADLESQLGQAQEELKHLKQQLVTAEAAKKEAQAELHKKAKKRNVCGPQKVSKEVDKSSKSRARSSPSEDVADDIQRETDVFEVPMEEEKVTVEPKIEKENSEVAKALDKENKDSDILELAEQEKQPLNELKLKDDEVNLLKCKFEEKEKELEEANKETEYLKKQISEADEAISSARSKEEEMSRTLNQVEEELKESRESSKKLKEKLEAVGGAKEELEAEMKRMRIQTEQWKKAADAAAAVLAAGPDMNHGRIPERCGSMDKHLGPMFEIPSGYTGFVGSPGNTDDVDDGFGGGRRKGGIRMFGDLWKKKGQK
ncbi:hypothetical protein CDL15_Pgr007060 [Punica granatum]|nr:hypothetical protein CDL15_Pgr007060 [Punica granatum]PKI47646.1 hypothetical protein CRG98_031932 [Punica granatum]